HRARLELLDDVVEVHFGGLLRVVGIRRGEALLERRVRELAEDFEAAGEAGHRRKQVAAEDVAALVDGVVGVVAPSLSCLPNSASTETAPPPPSFRSIRKSPFQAALPLCP